MKKLTNLIGSFIVAIALIAFPTIVGMGLANDWLERNNNDILIHPWFAILWGLCLIVTIGEVITLTIIISNEND